MNCLLPRLLLAALVLSCVLALHKKRIHLAGRSAARSGVEQLSISTQKGILHALGIESKEIADEKITATTSWDGLPATQSRLRRPGGSWSAGQNDMRQWIQVQLDQKTTITAVATQGREGSGSQWVTAFTIDTSEDCVTFTPYGREIGEVPTPIWSNPLIEFDGKNHIPLPVSAVNHDTLMFAAWVLWRGGNTWQRIVDFGVDVNRYVMFTPSSWEGKTRLEVKLQEGNIQRVEAQGLPANVWVHLAFSLDGTRGKIYRDGEVIADQPLTLRASQVTGESNWLGKSQYHADPLFNGRLEEVGIWNTIVNLKDVLKQGKKFRGNIDSNGIVRNELRPTVEAMCVRLRPKSWVNHISLRWELYGYLGPCIPCEIVVDNGACCM